MSNVKIYLHNFTKLIRYYILIRSINIGKSESNDRSAINFFDYTYKLSITLLVTTGFLFIYKYSRI